MKIEFTSSALEQYRYWEQHDSKIFDRVNALLNAIRDDPFRGIGKPEPLRYELSGSWSRRITQEHRLVYRITGAGPQRVCSVVQCRFHYR